MIAFANTKIEPAELNSSMHVSPCLFPCQCVLCVCSAQLLVLAVICRCIIFVGPYRLFVSVFPLPLCHVSLHLYVNPQLLPINMECLFIMRLPGLTSIYKHLSCSGAEFWCTALCEAVVLRLMLSCWQFWPLRRYEAEKTWEQLMRRNLCIHALIKPFLSHEKALINPQYATCPAPNSN